MTGGTGAVSWMVLVLGALILSLAGPAPLARPVLGQPQRTPAVVVEVVDGDTVDVLVDGLRERVRYIGLDTPETRHPSKPVQCFGPQASARNAELVADQPVQLERDVSERDQYGRLLRYVWVGETLVNAELLFEGYAQVLTYPPDVRYAELFLDLERQAHQAARGLWASCPH